MEERIISLKLSEAQAIYEWADAFVKQQGLMADCTQVESIVNRISAAFRSQEKPRLRLVADKETVNG